MACRFLECTPSRIRWIVKICEVVDLFLWKPFWFFFLSMLSILGSIRLRIRALYILAAMDVSIIPCLFIILMIGSWVTSGGFPSKFSKCCFHWCIRSHWLVAFSLALAVLFLLLTSFIICHAILDCLSSTESLNFNDLILYVFCHVLSKDDNCSLMGLFCFSIVFLPINRNPMYCTDSRTNLSLFR